MDYDIAILNGINRLIGYKVTPTPDGYELDLVAYSGSFDDYKGEQKVILTKGTKWTSKPAHLSLEQITYIVNKIKSWEKENDRPIESK